MPKTLEATIIIYLIYFQLILSTTLGSANVETSPSCSCSLAAIFLSILRIIFPDLVLGNPGVKCMRSGVAIGPIFSLTTFLRMSS